MLLEDGDLNLDNAIQTYVPAFPEKQWPHFAKGSLLFEPGTQYHHSDYGWILVSAAIETAAGQSFLTFMQERIFEPLAMRNTVPDPAPVEVDDDHPLFDFIRERIFDPRTTRKTVPDSANRRAENRVTSISRGSHRIPTTACT